VQEGAFNLYQARRDTRRDLLEIAPRLSLAASAELLTITDDLERELSFPANGLRRKYQLGAAVFEATGAWDRDRFVVEIEGPDDLQIFQTWFLSQDGSRLFLVIRVGEAVRGARPVGVNRVYDRVRRDLSPATRD
jgi:hypothetical protein